MVNTVFKKKNYIVTIKAKLICRELRTPALADKEIVCLMRLKMLSESFLVSFVSLQIKKLKIKKIFSVYFHLSIWVKSDRFINLPKVQSRWN